MRGKTLNNEKKLPAIIDNSTWFKRWFDSSFYHKLYANRDEKEAAGFIDELIAELQPTYGSSMLDLGCGNGRHSKYLASKGFNIMGIDLAASSIHQAKKSETSTLQFRRHDMRDPFGTNQFDFVFNFFTSFGYFKTGEEDNKVIKNISSSLKSEGILVMDYMNWAYAEKKLIAKEEKEIDGIMYHITRWTNEKHVFKKIIIEDMLFGKPLEYTEQVRKFSIEELTGLFTNNGLRLEKAYGNYQLGEYDKEESPRIILIAKKTNQ